MKRELDEFLPTLYDELRELAAAHMHQERIEHTLQPTALAHEVYLRLPVWSQRSRAFDRRTH